MKSIPWAGAVAAAILTAPYPAATCAEIAVTAPVAAWRLSADTLHEDRFQPTAGPWPADVVGKAAFGDQEPHALVTGPDARLLISESIDQLELPEEAISVEAWVRFDEVPTWGGFVSAVQDNGNFEKGWVLGSHAGRFSFALASTGADDGDGRLTYLHADDYYAPGCWYHVVGTYDGRQHRIYVDGRLAGSSEVQHGPILYPAKASFDLAVYRDANERYQTPGRLAEVSLFDRALSAEEIARRFDAKKDHFPGIVPKPLEVDGWPTYQRDRARSAYSPEPLALPLELAWTYRAKHAPKPAWPPPARQDFWNRKRDLKARVVYDRAFHPVAAEGHVYFGSSADDKLYCLDMATGQELWSFFADGPIRLAPTVDGQRVYFAADDGCAYCLKAADGALQWKTRVAPEARHSPGNGRLISAWPARTSVIVQDGRARLCTGLFPMQGAWSVELDAATGAPLQRRRLDFSPQGYLREANGRFAVATGRVPGRQLLDLHRAQMKIARSQVPLDDRQRYPYGCIGAGGMIIAGGEGTVKAMPFGEEQSAWEASVDGRPDGLAIADRRLLVSTDQGAIYCFAHAASKPQTGSPGTKWSSSCVAAPVPRHVGQSTDKLLEACPTRRGFCLVIGDEDGWLVHQLARRTELKLVGLCSDATKLEAARRRLDRAGLYGRATVRRYSGDALPYGDCLFNLVVVWGDGALPATSTATTPSKPSAQEEADDRENPEPPVASNEEMLRVLRPGGIAAFSRAGVPAASNAPRTDDEPTCAGPVDWSLLRKPQPENTGQWTHTYADLGNTTCSGDKRVGGPMTLQWFGRPGPREMVDRHHRTTAPLFCQGRLFIPGNDRFYAADAYNGTLLWEREVPGSRRIGVSRDCGSIVASPEVLYVAAGPRCVRLEAQTGKELRPFEVPPAADDSSHHWGYIALSGDVLLGSATQPGASRRKLSRQSLYETFFDHIPVVVSNYLFGLDRSTGRARWIYRDNHGAIVSSAIAGGDGRLYFLESRNPKTQGPSGRAKLAELLGHGASLVALDLSSGEVAWRRDVDYGALEHTCHLCYADGHLVLAGSRNAPAEEPNAKGNRPMRVWYDVHCHDAASGKPLWSRSQDNRRGVNGDHGEQDLHPVIVGHTVYVEPRAYELASGKPLDDWHLARGGHGCGTVSASATTMFFRAGNPAVCDLKSGTVGKLNTVSRPGCWINMLPAGGLLLMPEASSGCTCNFAIQGSMAYRPLEQ